MVRRKGNSPFEAHDHAHCRAEALAAAEALCQARGARLTDIRRRVFEMIWQSHRPVGAYELLDALKRERGGAAPPTVYRALEFLIEQGLIHRVEHLNAYVGCVRPEHPHGGLLLVCRNCGQAFEMEDGDLDAALERSAARVGFAMSARTIEIPGLCGPCAQHKAAP